MMASPRSRRSRPSRAYTTTHNTARAATWTAPSILVASTLIINAFDSCQAAPRPVPTGDEYQRRSQKRRARAFADVDDVVPSLARDEESAQEEGHEARHYIPGPIAFGKRDGTISSSTPSKYTYAVATGTGRNLVVPPAFASSIASSWDPRQRSVWFQRKAVIITSVFLAILIVLIIGAAAFVRDKREANAEGEVDTSDEAALKRMKQERDMRNGGKKRKGKRKKEEAGGDEVSIKSGKGGSGGTATGIALRWAKIPIRGMKKRNGRTSTQSKTSSRESSLHDGDLPSSYHEPAGTSPLNSSEDTGSSRTRVAQEAGESPSESTQSSGDSQSSHPPSSSRDPLSVADMSAAEAELERQMHGTQQDQEIDAFPPAYISRARHDLHPSANRQLVAGSSRDVDVTSTNEEKRPMPSNESMDTSGGENLPSLPSIAEVTTSSNAQDHLSGHVATDDKTLLGQLHHAASAPSAPPGQERASDTGASNDSSVTPSLQPSSLASAPLLDIAGAPDDDVTEEEIEAIESTNKGKAASISMLLPAPPRPLSSSNFSRFDMPYVMDNAALSPSVLPPTSIHTKSKVSSEKEQEASEELRKTMALIESKPEDMMHLPKYESAQLPANTPSAPAQEEDEMHEQTDDSSLPPAMSAPSVPSVPSAPPPED